MFNPKFSYVCQPVAVRPQQNTFEGAVERCYAVKSELCYMRGVGGENWKGQWETFSVNLTSGACFDMSLSLRNTKLNKQSSLLTCILGMICSHPLIQLIGNIGQLSVCI